MIAQRSSGARALVIISTIVVVLVLLLATAVHAFGGEGGGGETIEYQVRGGDSLWSIAVDLASDDDPRAVIGAISELNDLSGSVIHPGDVLLVPAR